MCIIFAHFAIKVFAQAPTGYCLNQNATNLNQTVNQSNNLQNSGYCNSNAPDGISSMYIPSASTSTLFFRVNFVFLIHPTAPTPFSGFSIAQLTSLVNPEIDTINARFKRCGNVPSFLPVPNPSPLVPDSKIRIILNNVYKISTTDAIMNSSGPTAAMPNLFSQHGQDKSSVMNIIFYCDDTHPGAGFASYLFGSTDHWVTIKDLSTRIHNSSNLGWTDLIWHELCHNLGHLADHYYPALHNNADPLTWFYIPDDAGVETTANSTSCPLVGPACNNVMANTFCRQTLSARQIAAMHYLANSNVTKKYVDFNLSSPCIADHNYIWMINSNTNWTSPQYPPGNIVVKPGAHLIISSCVYMKADSKIMVEAGGKLSIINGRVTNACFSQWKGIEVNSFFSGTLPQVVNPITQMPNSNTGMLVLDNATISNAEVGVRMGFLTQINGLQYGPSNGTSGGIIYSKNSLYLNNTIGVLFHPYYGAGVPINTIYDNLSYFKGDKFKYDDTYMGNAAPEAAISINASFKIGILGCDFDAGKPKCTYGIKCINGSFILKDYCTNISNNNCVGNLTQNNFKGFRNCVFLSSNNINIPSIIDHAVFDQASPFIAPSNITNYSRGAIYMLNNFGSSVINCTFGNHQPIPSNPQYSYGLYLDNCDGYVVENNIFDNAVFYNNGGQGLAWRNGGIFVNNSGPNSNAIYNNTFNNLHQGIWAQNINYNYQNGDGLVMNCNDFSNGIYNIGVQASLKPNTILEATNPVSIYESTGNNGFCFGCLTSWYAAGIAESQGVIGQGEQLNVRNRYDVQSCNSNSENKFFIDTKSGFVVTSHGSFQGSQFHPTPQTNNSCSNAAELFDFVGISPINPEKTSYCPKANLPGLGSLALNQNATGERTNINVLKNSLISKLDMGNTALFLQTIINSSISATELKTNLLEPDFLSDTVLKAYFLKANVPHSFLREVFAKNSPIQPNVWKLVETIGLSENEKRIWDSLQGLNKISMRADLESRLILAQNRLGLINNEKVRRFLNAENGILLDSILAIYNFGEVVDAKFKKVDLYITSANYSQAQSLINTLLTEKSAFFERCKVMQYALEVNRNPENIASMSQDTSLKSFLKNAENCGDYIVEGYAKSLQVLLFGYKNEEIRLQPGTNESSMGRSSQNTEQSNSLATNAAFLNLTDGIKIFPNPAQNKLFLEIAESNGDLNINICDLNGKTLITQNSVKSGQFNLTSLDNGIYLVNLFKQGVLFCTKKIVIIK